VNVFRQQLRQHSVALLSLAIALTGLAYNTWRNEQTEANRNVRTAGVELLLKLGELDQVVFFNHYDHDQVRGNPRLGWAYVLTIRDLGFLTGPPADAASKNLAATWERNWAGLGEHDESADNISTDIDSVRNSVLAVLVALD
jgi:hypothetical protein